MKNVFSKILMLILAVALCFSIISCEEEKPEIQIKPNTNPEYAREALEEAGYNVIYTSGLQATIMDSAATAIISATNGDEKINITYYSDYSAANSGYLTLLNNHELDKEIAEKFGKEYNLEVGMAENSQAGIYLSYIGTPEAIKAAR